MLQVFLHVANFACYRCQHACSHVLTYAHDMHVTDLNMQKMEHALSCNIHVAGSNMHCARD